MIIDELINYLFSIQDIKYRDFNKKLINTKYEIIGVKIPILKNISKKLDINMNFKDKYFEEVMIEGFIISNIKDEELFYKYFIKHINKIDNWSLCDSFVSSIKIVKKYEDKYFNEAIKLSLSDDEFISRVGIVMILDYFIKKDNLNIIFDTLNKIKSDKFYLNMAISWLICELYIKYPNETLKFIKNNNLNKFTINKAISKINDSNRINIYEKNMLKQYKK